MERRRFIRLVGGGSVAAATLGSLGLSGCSAALPAEAIEAWRGPGPVQPGDDVRRWLLSYAILAAHSHNLQSWVADLGAADVITLSCDPTRLLPQTDPLSRQIMMSHGTFLELLDIAARERGLRADITLFPQGVFEGRLPDQRPIARIRLQPDTAVRKDPLFAHILHRHTNRNRYDPGRSVPEEVWAAIHASVDASTVRVGHVGLDRPDLMQAHRVIANEAWRVELCTARIVKETFSVLRVGAAEVAAHRDGLTLMAPWPVALARLGLFDRSKVPAAEDYATTSQIRDFAGTLDATPGFLWMVTPANDRASQVNAGRAYARVQLAATAQGIAMQPLSQALQEYPEQKQTYADIHALVGATQPGQTVQMWARAGYAAPVEPSPRRRLSDFIRAS